MAPMRLKNLTQLQIGVHLLIDRHGGMTLKLPEEEVKNGMPLEIVLPTPTVRIIALYLSSYRPKLAAQGSSRLFPGIGRGGNPKSAQGLRDQINNCIARRVGLRFNPHLFRHLAAKIILKRHPGAYGLVQRVLCHKSIQTTMNFYTGNETTAAFTHYHELVMHLRGVFRLPRPSLPPEANASPRVGADHGHQSSVPGRARAEPTPRWMAR
jgi:integrase